MIPLLGEENHTVIRHDATTTTDGVADPATGSSFTVRGSMQPFSPREMALLPELQRTRARSYLYTRHTSRLLVSSEVDRVKGDLVVDPDGQRWEVVGVERWTTFGLAHYKYTLAHKGVDEGGA